VKDKQVHRGASLLKNGRNKGRTWKVFRKYQLVQNIIHRLLKIHRLYNRAMPTDIYIYIAKRIQIGHNIEKYYMY